MLALVFLLGFGGFFVFGGFQSATVDLHRDSAGVVSGTLTRSHFFGLYTVSAELRAISRATIETGTTRPRPGMVSHVSGVALLSESGSSLLFAGLSNVDDTYKHHIVRTLNQYIGARDTRAFHETFTVRNLFGWVGLPFFLLGVYAALMWPATLFGCCRRSSDERQ